MHRFLCCTEMFASWRLCPAPVLPQRAWTRLASLPSAALEGYQFPACFQCQSTVGEGAGVYCQVFKARKNNDLHLVDVLHNRDYCNSHIPWSPFGWLITLALK